jgi:hypothetical protein
MQYRQRRLVIFLLFDGWDAAYSDAVLSLLNIFSKLGDKKFYIYTAHASSSVNFSDKKPLHRRPSFSSLTNRKIALTSTQDE